MWIKIQRKYEDFDSQTTDLKLIKYEHYINLDNVEDIVIKEKSIKFDFGNNEEIIIIPNDTENYTEVKEQIKEAMKIKNKCLTLFEK